MQSAAAIRLGQIMLALGLSWLGGCATVTPQTGGGPADLSTATLRQSQRSAVAQARADADLAPAAAQGRIADTDLARAGIPVTAVEQTEVDGTEPEAVPAGHVGLSDEQDFTAVSARETIESDRERLAAQRAAYQQIAPQALPQRSGSSDTTVIDFALSTSNAVGEPIWPRSGRGSQEKLLRACAKYPSQDVAQEQFLKNGGPQRDSRGVDPDGDGFACFWDPTPFRLAEQGAVPAPVAREVLPGEAPPGTVGPDGIMVRTSDYDQTPLQ